MNGASGEMRLFRRIRITSVLFLAILLPLDLCFGEDLVNAAREGAVEEVRSLLANGADVNSTDDKGCTALHWAAEKGHGEVVRLLTANGAKIDARDNWAATPLYAAAMEGRSQATELLIAAGADVNARTKHGHAPLHFAVNEAVAELLIANGADISAKANASCHGETPLHIAAHNYELPVLKVLIANGADINGKDDLGRNCLHVARGKEMIELLIAEGTDVSAKDRDGRTPLHFPSSKAKGLPALVANGADVDARDNQGRTPLYMVDDRDLRDADSLISEGANVNAVDSKGRTPLHVAASKGCERIAKLLIDNGADVNTKDEDGLTALDYGSRAGREGLIEMLSVAEKLSAKGKGTFWLRYKPEEKRYYYVERSFRYVESDDEENAEMIREYAIIKHGRSYASQTGVMRFNPEVRLLSEEGKDDHIQHEFWPVKTRLPTGECKDSWRWGTQVILRDYDMFPVFPTKAVKVGDSWEMNHRIRFTTVEGESRGANGAITHAFEAIEPVEGVECAKIDYRFSVPFEMIERSDDTETCLEYAKNLEGTGTTYFDPERGVVVRQDFNCRVTADWRWTGEPDNEYVRTHPNWDQSHQNVFSSRITSESITEEEASRLIKVAETARAKLEAAKSVQPVEEKGPRRKYFLESATIQRNNLLKKNKEKVFTDRAFIHFGSGAKQAGGQIESVPNVVYVNDKKERLPEARHPGPAITPIASDKLTLVTKLPENVGSAPESPLALQLFFSPFLFPIGIEAEMKKGLSWSPTIYTSYPIGTGFTFPVQIKCRVAGHKVTRGRRCAIIKYSLFYEFKTADHPELFTQDELRRERGKYVLKGDGTAYFDPVEKIIVEQRQTVSFSRRWEGYEDHGSGKAMWSLACDEETLVKVQISLESD